MHLGRHWGNADAPDTLFAATVETEPTFRVISHEPVLSGAYFPEFWDLHPDGDRIIAAQLVGEADGTGGQEIILVQNWFEELKRRVGN